MVGNFSRRRLTLSTLFGQSREIQDQDMFMKQLIEEKNTLTIDFSSNGLSTGGYSKNANITTDPHHRTKLK